MAGASLGLMYAQQVWADPFRRWLVALDPLRTVRIDGTVTLAGKPKAGVAVTDGRSVVRTDKNGRYTLLADAARPFVYLSLPRGCELPRNPGQATARFYEPITKEKDTQQVNWALQPAKLDDDKHGFLVFADPQPRDAEDMAKFHNETIQDAGGFSQAYSTLPLFAVGCGDIMWDDLSLLPAYERALADLDLPAFSVVGNHDLDMQGVRTDGASTRTFERFFGPTYYSFDRGEVHYVVLDNVFWYGKTDVGAYMGYVDDQQLDWLRQDLAAVPTGSTVIVFTHIPIYTKLPELSGEEADGSILTVNRALLYDILTPYKTHFINGHMHWTEHLTDGGATHHTCGAACGAWWTGPICYDGTPNGYGLYEVSGSSFTWLYKSTGLPAEKQFELYLPGSDPKAPDEIVANVWGADDTWEVWLVGEGSQRVRMSRRLGQDPTSVRLHLGANLPTKHGWVEPQQSNHLFYGSPLSASGPITVEAIDRFGRRYTETLNRG